MRFARGTKVRITWTGPTGRAGFALRWWNQVDALIEKYRAAGCHSFRVKGHGWKNWRKYTPKEERSTK